MLLGALGEPRAHRLYSLTRWRSPLFTGHVDDGLGRFLGRFFVEKALSVEAKKLGETIITNIKMEFAKKLKAVLTFFCVY
jgi:hypothetical protein